MYVYHVLLQRLADRQFLLILESGYKYMVLGLLYYVTSWKAAVSIKSLLRSYQNALVISLLIVSYVVIVSPMDEQHEVLSWYFDAVSLFSTKNTHFVKHSPRQTQAKAFYTFMQEERLFLVNLYALCTQNNLYDTCICFFF